MESVVGILIALILIAYVYLFISWCWSAVRRAGYNGAWSLLLLLPLVNIIAMYVFAFSSWPVEYRRLGTDAGSSLTGPQ